MNDDIGPEKNRDGLDFGDDADVLLPSDPEFDAWLVKAAPALNAPPATPRLQMWDAIAAAQETSAAASRDEIPGVRPFRRARLIWPAAIAAALLIGVGVDRYALRSAHEPSRIGSASVPIHTEIASAPSAASTDTTSAPSATSAASAKPTRVAVVKSSTPSTRTESTSPSANDPAHLYRLAAVQTLGQAEALLTAYRASDRTGPNAIASRQLGLWGRDVLSSTRLLLDSPAGSDPQLRPLLNDLELVLVQIIQLSGTPLGESDRALIDRAMREHDLLQRIRTAVPAGVAGTASEE
jgi:cell division septation protein DedD